MKLYDYLVERFCIPEEDQKEMKTDLERWRKESEKQLYKKNPPYLLEPYMKQIERDTNRYKTKGGKVGKDRSKSDSS